MTPYLKRIQVQKTGRGNLVQQKIGSMQMRNFFIVVAKEDVLQKNANTGPEATTSIYRSQQNSVGALCSVPLWLCRVARKFLNQVGRAGHD